MYLPFPRRCTRIGIVPKRYLCKSVELVRSLEASAYIDPAKYEIERKKLLGPSWQLITHESRLLTRSSTAPATYVAETVCGWPTIVVRSSKTGEIKAYHNVCRHKAGPLEWDNSEGACSLHGLKCKYHGWTYSMDGELRGVPGFGEDGLNKLCKKDFSLWPMRTAVWRGLVFVQMLPPSVPDLPMSGPEADAAFMADNKDFCERLSGPNGIPLEQYHFREGDCAVHKLNCNWKVYVENYLEGYHIPTIHPSLHREVDMQSYRVRVGQGFVEHEAATVSESAYNGIWVWHAPTLAINMYGSGLSLERMVPTGPNTTEIRYTFLFRGEDADAAHAMATSGEVTAEDIEVCEAVQRGLESGVYVTPGMLSPRHENGVAYFQNLVRETLRSE